MENLTVAVALAFVGLFMGFCAWVTMMLSDNTKLNAGVTIVFSLACGSCITAALVLIH